GISLSRKLARLFQNRLTSWGFEEVDKLMADITYYIQADTENAEPNSKQFIRQMETLFADLGLKPVRLPNGELDPHSGIDADGRTSLIRFAATEVEAQTMLDQANAANERVIIVLDAADSRNRKAIPTQALQDFVNKEGSKRGKGYKLVHLKRAIDGALVLKYGEDFDGVNEELKPLLKGAPQKTNFSGKEAKVFLSLMSNAAKEQKLQQKNGELKTAQAARNTTRVNQLQSEIQEIQRGRIDLAKLENSLTQATNTKIGIIKDAALKFHQSATRVSRSSLAAGSQFLTVGADAEIENSGVTVEARVDGDFLEISGRYGTDRVRLADLAEEGKSSTILTHNRHIAVTRSADSGTLIFRQQIKLSGSSATYSPVLKSQAGLDTVFSDRSPLRLDDQKDAEGTTISTGWEYTDALASTSENTIQPGIQNVVNTDIEASHRASTNEEIGRTNRKRF
ncbi:MAG: hypothetical protein KDA77_21055, partial [Planctomycetaceae bacterium]|nr:hypothetical protein [Planctomycetaceae bacterium]